MNGSSEYLLEMRNISKHFPGVQALDDVTFKVKRGEIHALVGENGAGKSTLMKVLLGIIQPDKGEIILKGERVKIYNPRIALSLGLSMIHQEISLVPERTVAENIWLGREPTLKRVGFLKWSELFSKTEKLLKELDLIINPKQKVSSLNVAGMQMVEIARAVSYNSDLIIMDEPTSALSEKEVEKLFNIIRSLKEKGTSVIYISHKLDEIFKIADRVTALRDGQYIGTSDITQVDHQTLISMMVGREIKNIFPKKQIEIGNTVMEVKGISRKGAFEDISFSVRKGEILGIAGLMGAGRTEVVRAIFGIDPIDSGSIFIDNEKVKIDSPKKAIKLGIGLVTEDRKKYGLALCRSVKENISMANMDKFCKLSFISRKKELKACQEMIRLLSIKTPSHKQTVSSLSGGNQQKVVLANWLQTQPKILILDEPTRGIDVGAKSEIHKLMTQFAEEGMAIIMISSELPEILGMSDRILVMHEGRVKGEFSRDEASQEKILACAVGGEQSGK
ncbi:MAG: sugar ABC transporter ATP-binding protein [Clostridiaceae bacterium]|nr:sugar ABC transporter ATP-binding protein [Clostridiaceae bacterium]